MHRASVAVALLMALGISYAGAPIDLKSVPLDEFMHGQLKGAIKLPIPVPATYEWAPLAKAPVSYAYWMRPEDVASANSAGDLPAEHGYMYGKISTNVGYDKDKNVFIGADDAETMKKIKGMFPSVTAEHFTYDEYPVLLMTMAAPDSGKYVYAMYVGLNISTKSKKPE